MSKPADFASVVKKYMNGFHAVVPFDPGHDKLIRMDFTEANKSLTPAILQDTDLFTRYIDNLLLSQKARYGIGGYNEHRTIYQRSARFDSNDGTEPRRLHLGIDIWGKAGTPVYAPINGIVHSFSFNDIFGDYGATLIIQHELDGFVFHTLYGHLSLTSINEKKEGQEFTAGDWIASFGVAEENGHWPPHLHFQVILDMHGKKGDYHGVCKFSGREIYLANSPDPDLLLNMMKYTTAPL
jgi:peptidoglycan LD-endopeptidase LytH